MYFNITTKLKYQSSIILARHNENVMLHSEKVRKTHNGRMKQKKTLKQENFKATRTWRKVERNC